LFGHSVLENQIQALSRTLSVFKHFPCLLENLEEKIQGLLRTRKNPVQGLQLCTEFTLLHPLVFTKSINSDDINLQKLPRVLRREAPQTAQQIQ